MKPLASIKSSLPLLLALLTLWPLITLAEEGGNTKCLSGPHQSAPITRPATPPAEYNGEDLQSLRQRYHRDPTGVRARIGMCRHGHGKGYGNGHGDGGGHGRCRGGMRGHQRPFPEGEKQWNTP